MVGRHSFAHSLSLCPLPSRVSSRPSLASRSARPTWWRSNEFPWKRTRARSNGPPTGQTPTAWSTSKKASPKPWQVASRLPSWYVVLFLPIHTCMKTPESETANYDNLRSMTLQLGQTAPFTCQLPSAVARSCLHVCVVCVCARCAWWLGVCHGRHQSQGERGGGTRDELGWRRQLAWHPEARDACPDSYAYVTMRRIRATNP